MTEAEQAPPGVDPTAPTPARLYDYYLGGTSNFQVDREAAERLRASLPELADAAWVNRGFHQRAARWMASTRGIRQFADLGSGLPTQGTTHQAVQEVPGGAKVVYVDYDPMVRAHATALLNGTGTTTLIEADLRDAGAVLGHPEFRALIDLTQPTGLLITAVLHFVADDADPWGLVQRYAGALAPGSYVALSHATADRLPPRAVTAMYDTYKNASERIYLRSRAAVQKLFGGHEPA